MTAAAQHEARLAKAPERLPAEAHNAVFRSMLKSGLLAEVPAPLEHVDLGWRQDEAVSWIALRITENDLTPIGLRSAGLAPVLPPGDTQAAMTSDSPLLSSEAASANQDAPAGRLTLRTAAAAVVAAREASHPEWRTRLQDGDEDLEHFVHEVRRVFPFIPFIGGRVLEPFTWRGHGFEPGDRVLMDLYGTNRDPRSWEDPEAFRPERFRGRPIGSHEFIPQGGGAHAETHRCRGEWVTIEQMKTITRMLVREMRYVVPDQDLGIDLGRLPALPNSRLVMRDVGLVAATQ